MSECGTRPFYGGAHARIETAGIFVLKLKGLEREGDEKIIQETGGGYSHLHHPPAHVTWR